MPIIKDCLSSLTVLGDDELMIFDKFRSKSSSEKEMAKSTREKKPKKPKAASSVKAKIKPQVKSKAAGGPNENPAPEISVESPQPAAKYPLFYNNVTTLTAEQHSALKFRTKRDFTFNFLWLETR